MAYFDGVVAAGPRANKAAHVAHAKAAMVVFREQGCIGGPECWSDDVPVGKRTDFWRAVAAEPGEAVVLSWLIWPDKATRDAGMAKVFADPRMAEDANPMPFDGTRLIPGGVGVATTIGAVLIRRQNVTAIWVTGMAGGLADLGYLAFVDIPGHVHLLPASLMTRVSGTAVALSFWVWVSVRRMPA